MEPSRVRESLVSLWHALVYRSGSLSCPLLGKTCAVPKKLVEGEWSMRNARMWVRSFWSGRHAVQSEPVTGQWTDRPLCSRGGLVHQNPGHEGWRQSFIVRSLKVVWGKAWLTCMAVRGLSALFLTQIPIPSLPVGASPWARVICVRALPYHRLDLLQMNDAFVCRQFLHIRHCPVFRPEDPP